MPEPTDPFTFVDGPGNTASGAQVNSRFTQLYNTLKRSVTGVDWTNIAVGGIREDCMAGGADGLAKGIFSVYRVAAASPGTGGIVVFDTEVRDISNWFDIALGRYTPQVAGYYRFNWGVGAAGALTVDNFWISTIAKNGVTEREGQMIFQRGTTGVRSMGTAQVQMNGTTDFVDVRILHNNGGGVNLQVNSPDKTFFQGELIAKV